MEKNNTKVLGEQPTLFHSRVFQAIIMSGLFLQIGIWVRNFSVLLFVMEKTDGDPFAISMISVAEFAPIFIFSFIGGTFADRWPPKKTMVWCDVLSAISVFVVLITLHFGTWQVVFFATLISAILSQFSQPSGMKLFKLHLPEEQIQTGMSVYQTVFAVFMVFGPILGTFAFQSFGIEVSIAITGLAFLLSAGALGFLPKDYKLEEDTAATTIWQEMKSGIQYVLKKRELKFVRTMLFGSWSRVRLYSTAIHFPCNGTVRLTKGKSAMAVDHQWNWHDYWWSSCHDVGSKGCSPEIAHTWYADQCNRISDHGLIY